MSNKTRTYIVHWCWKLATNRGPINTHTVTATTVQRAISKVLKDLNDGKWEAAHESHVIPKSVDEELDGDDFRASDLLVIDVHPKKL